MKASIQLLEKRTGQVGRAGQGGRIQCDKPSLAGAVSQRACVFCGSRVVLYPVADALHLVHGPIGCAAYTWDIRGALSSGPQLHRLSFSTDLGGTDVVYGGEKKLYGALCELIAQYRPKAAFVYATCIAGLIGDDLDAVCRRVSKEQGIPVLPVQSEGFRGTKKDGYAAACNALFELVGTGPTTGISPRAINLLGEFNLAGEAWLLKRYYEELGLEVVATITGDGRVDDIRRAHGAALNVVQCSGSMFHLARAMKERYGIPYVHAYVDAHKIVFERRIVVYGEEDLVVSLAGFLGEIGALPVICATGEKSGQLRRKLEDVLPDLSEVETLEGADFIVLEQLARAREAELLLGNSKGYPAARALGVPLLRLGFPLHDRFGGARLLHLGYGGTQQLFDALVNALIEKQQMASPVGYMFM